MYVPAQTNNAGWRALCDRRFATSYGHDLGRVTIMKHTLLRDINQDMALRSARRNLHALAVVHDPARIQGLGRVSEPIRRPPESGRQMRRGEARPVNRSPRSKQRGFPLAPEQNWTGRRKAKPAEFLFPTTMRWIATLPSEFQPTAIGKAFSRIANALAALWTRQEAFTSYLDDLLIDKRGARRGFPIDALAELHALRTYYTVSRPHHLVVRGRSEQPL